MNLQTTIQAALEHHKAGRREQAKSLYQQILAAEPKSHAAMFMLGVLLMEMGDLAQAAPLLEKAAKLKPDSAEYQNAFGSVLFYTHKLPESAAAYRTALKLRPHYLEAYLGLGKTLLRMGDARQAAEVLAKAATVRPDYAPAHTELANALRDCGELDRALAAALRGVQVDPRYAWGHNILGMIHHDRGHYEPALASFRTALIHKPDMPEAYLNMAQVRRSCGQFTESAAALRKAQQLAPRDPRPAHNLGVVLSEIGENNEAIQSFRSALSIYPSYSEAHSALLLTLNYCPGYSPRQRFEEHLRWERQHAANLPPAGAAAPDRRKDRVLRVGYVSPDLYRHSVSWYMEPILRSHERGKFEVFIYSDCTRPDDLTARLKALPLTWREISAVGNEAAAQLIHRDRIDILIDLAGHTRRGRLLMFARKPAPVQVTYLGYPNTTGLSSMNYRLTDNIADPSGESDALHTEKLIRLPNGFLCYSPPPESPDVAVGALAARGGAVTFASFNNQAKITKEAVELWSRILSAVPGSKLLLKNRVLGDSPVVSSLIQLFGRHGINRDRLDLRPPASGTADHLRVYDEADIALDTFPYNGTTTTCEALWMGVPVITVAGGCHAARVSASILHRLNLPELVAPSPDDYVRIAVDLAADWAELDSLRSTLRDRMKASVLLNARQITADIEAAYQEMWQALL